MAIEDDVLVLGGGIAGITAALSAAERGERVRLLSYKQSTLRHASGLIDVLGYPPGSDDEGPIVDPFEALPDLPNGHPYERVGAEAVREALLFFDAVAGDAYEGTETDANALVPTHGGTVKPTARYPATTAAGLASDPRDALFVGFETLPDFDAPLAAAHLRAAGVPFDPRGVTLSFPGDLRADAKVTRYAHLLDRDEPVDTGAGGVPARAALAETVRTHLDGESRVGFPAILGDEHAPVVRRDLEERLGVDVFEVPMGPPSLPGMRLEDLLFDALDEAGVRVTTGVPAVDYEADGDRIDHVVVDRKGQEVPYSASEFVLATGGLVGKGVRSSREEVPENGAADGSGGGARETDSAVDGGGAATGPDGATDRSDDGTSGGSKDGAIRGSPRSRDRVFEPIFDCHVAHSADRYEWFDEDAFGDHPFARFGVAVDRELRPLDANDDPEFSNLRAAGAVLSGYDFAAEKSGAGVSLATGYVAGDRAGEEVSG